MREPAIFTTSPTMGPMGRPDASIERRDLAPAGADARARLQAQGRDHHRGSDGDRAADADRACARGAARARGAAGGRSPVLAPDLREPELDGVAARPTGDR